MSRISEQIPGWFLAEEAQALYDLVRSHQPRRILEIGHFLGRSTAAICEAIRDMGRAVEFNSYDLGFTTAEEFCTHYARILDVPQWSHVPPEYLPVFNQHTTTTEVAKANLSRFGLDPFVNLISGDFTLLEKTQYDFIFCDAVHDPKEIAVNVPPIIAASEDDCWWAFHDTTPLNCEAVLQYDGVRFVQSIGSLGIFRFSRPTTQP